MVDKSKIKVVDVDDELNKATSATKSTVKRESVTIEDQFRERTLIVKAFVFLMVFVVAVFVVIFAYQLLTDGDVSKTMDVFQKLAAIASPIVTLVLGYYFGSKAKR
jgi:hypothetical protein